MLFASIVLLLFFRILFSNRICSGPDSADKWGPTKFRVTLYTIENYKSTTVPLLYYSYFVLCKLYDFLFIFLNSTQKKYTEFGHLILSTT